MEGDCRKCLTALSPSELREEMVVCKRCLKKLLDIEETDEDNFPDEYYENAT